MKKYFITSDTHSFYTILMKALKRKGFDVNNPEHIFVLVGDLFDRGEESKQLYEWVKALPRERRILIRGNHEILFRELVKKGYAESHDLHNGTLDTLYQLNDWDDAKETHDHYKRLAQMNSNEPDYDIIRDGLWRGRKMCFKSPIVKEVVDWFASDEWVNYWETEHYIFAHGWIPLKIHINWDVYYSYGYIEKTAKDEYREDWRNATDVEWEDATWFNWRENYQLVKQGLNQTGKTIVVGHWHTSDLYKLLNGTKKFIYDCPIYKSKRYNVIGLDACTAGSGKANILVLSEDEL